MWSRSSYRTGCVVMPLDTGQVAIRVDATDRRLRYRVSAARPRASRAYRARISLRIREADSSRFRQISSNQLLWKNASGVSSSWIRWSFSRSLGVKAGWVPLAQAYARSFMALWITATQRLRQASWSRSAPSTNSSGANERRAEKDCCVANVPPSGWLRGHNSHAAWACL